MIKRKGIRKRRRFILKSAAALLMCACFSMSYSCLTDPSASLTFSERQYYSAEYHESEGFTVREIVRPEIVTGKTAGFIADIIQSGNFIKTSFLSDKKKRQASGFPALYSKIVLSKFRPGNTIYLTTGDPHSRAFYLRNFAFFYEGLLDPETAVTRQDYINRMRITLGGLEFMLTLYRGLPFTTTAVPAGGALFAAVNYNSEPSDSILGVLASLDYLVNPRKFGYSRKYAPVQAAGTGAGKSVLNRYRDDLRQKITAKLKHLRPFMHDGKIYLIPDRDQAMSAATDVRNERARFIVSANFYAMARKAVSLGILRESEFREISGMGLKEYRDSIIELFAGEGYVRNSMLSGEGNSKDRALNIVLDFVHTAEGFWNISDSRDFKILKNTADIVLSDSRFFDKNMRGIKMSVENPSVLFFYRFTAPEYQGKVVWPYYNMRFAGILLSVYEKSGDRKYLECAGRIISYIKEKTVQFGGFPEVLDEEGNMYRTFAYNSAHASSWIPGFMCLLNRYEKAAE